MKEKIDLVVVYNSKDQEMLDVFSVVSSLFADSEWTLYMRRRNDDIKEK